MKYVKPQIKLEHIAALVLILVVTEELYAFLLKTLPNYGLPIFDRWESYLN
jgi:hypothetical protein